VKTLLKSAALIFLFHVGMAVFFYTRGDYCASYYWAAGLLSVAALPYLIAIFRDKFIFYEGIYIYLAAYVISYTAVMTSSLDEINFDPEVWAYVMQAVFAGAVAFLFGYWSKLGRVFAIKLPLKNFMMTDERLLKLPPKFYLVGWALRILIYLNIGFNVFSGWRVVNILLKDLIMVGLMMDAYFWFSSLGQRTRAQHTKKCLKRFVFFLSLELISAFLGGMSGAIFAIIVLVLIAYIKSRNKIPFFAVAVTFFIFVYFVIPFMKTFRVKYWAGADLATSIQYGINGFSDKEVAKEKRQGALLRISNPLEMAIIASEKMREGVRIRTYEGLFDYTARFIPRFIWPSKPSVDYNRIGKELGILAPEDYSTSISLTLIAAFIMSNGILSVIIGMFFVGVIIRVFWDWLMVRSQGNFFTFIIYFTILHDWVGFDDVYVLIHSTISFILYTYFLLGFINKRKTFK
jgi:hypothetical protein